MMLDGRINMNQHWPMTDQWQARHLDQATCCHPLPCPRRFDRFDAGYAGGRQEVHPGGRAGPHETHPRASLWCGPGKGPGRAWEGPGKGPGRAREAMGWVRDLGILDRDHQAKHTGTNRLRRLRRLRTWWFWPALDCSTNIRDKLETDETKKLGPVNELKFQAGPWQLWLGFCLVGFNLYQLGHTWSFGAQIKQQRLLCIRLIPEKLFDVQILEEYLCFWRNISGFTTLGEFTGNYGCHHP